MLGPFKPHNFRSVTRFLAITWLFCVAFAPAYAAETTPVDATAEVKIAVVEQKKVALPTPQAEIEAKEEKIINITVEADIDSSIIVNLDGESLTKTDVRRAENGALYVNAMPIFETLESQVEFDKEVNALIVKRSQDGVVMELYTDTGIVKADGRALGRLTHFGEVSDRGYILTPNAISVLTGTNGKFDKENNILKFKLDPRLKIATGYEIYVNDFPLNDLSVQAKSVGPVLLLPIRPIAESLGHTLTLLDGGQILQVKRAQDSAVLALNLDTGLIKLGEAPIGISRDVSYIDPINLLLPVSALEALTGTNIVVTGGSSRIDVNLDDRLSGALQPGENVAESARKDKLTPESLSFHLGPDTINTVTLDAHGGAFNGRLRYETPDLPSNAAELEPAWLSVDFTHLSGIRGSVGDYSSNLRELDSVGLRRVRGLALNKVTEKGRWAAVVGVPTQGSRKISEDQSRQTFGGLAAGLRYADRKGWEAGLAATSDSLSDDQRVVLSAISGSLGRKKDKKTQWTARADAGYFNGPTRERSIDLRFGGSVQYEANKDLRFDGNIQYEGVEFARSTLVGQERENLTDEQQQAEIDRIEQIRTAGLDFLSMGVGARYSPNIDNSLLNDPAVAINAEVSRAGITKSAASKSETRQLSLGGSAGIANTGMNMSVSGRVFETKYANIPEQNQSGETLSVSNFFGYKDVTVRSQYEYNHLKGEKATQSASVTANMKSYRLPLPKSAVLSAAPSVSALWSNGGQTSLRGGVTANFASGELFGKKNQVTATLGILQSLSSKQGSESDQFFSVAYGRRVKLGRNMTMGVAYRNNLKGDHRVGLVLDGRFDFNEKRRYIGTKEGRGILKGQVFLDANRDGIRQDEEKPFPNIAVKIKGTGLALRTDNSGFYTIQNIKTGLYEVQIDARGLPLGYDLSSTAITRVTIGDGQISTVLLPIHQRGQITGFAYVDENGDGEHTKGEERIEGATLTLSSDKDETLDPKTVYSATFGQYAFDDLPAGTYTVTVKPNKKARIEGGETFKLDISEFPELMARRNIIIQKSPITLRVENVKTVEAEDTDVPPDNPITSVQTSMEASPP